MDSLTRAGLAKTLVGPPPSRQTRMFEISVDNPRYPDMLKPITEYYVGETAGGDS